MSQNILITGPSLAPAAADVLTRAGYVPVYVPPYTNGEGLIEVVRMADPVGILARMGRIDETVFAAAPRLRVISKHGAGVDNIDVEAATARGIPVLNAAGANAVSVAEQAMALLFAVAKRIIPLDRGIREGRWEKPGFQGRELAGSVMGLVAFGAISRQTARFAKGLGISVRAHDPFSPTEAFAAEGVERVEDLDELFASCDIISLHCPLTPMTRNMVNAQRLSRMKPGAIIINTARGGLIDEPALAEALASGRISGAGLDTFAQEPPPAEHPFWTEPRLVLSPHIGGVTEAANIRVGVEAAQGIVDLLEGRPVPEARIVNRAELKISV
ncbi:hydroxyacid dehydrogenase [Paracoccus sp. PS-1]|uniref:hydroxyacid dehydrogenase n=1 Tax=unclassified Paracoccus (in: a-proteobacteria) TaxID=2688777 RepID=UPI0004907D5C|nr:MULTISPECIES: hydroxyacid dehydrogenase [unclassified Paracoccus (in: a-proteobacteria)]MDQ7262634.1 hydroxyacid dehydrogenase [Paracoccus sp. PS1]